MMNQNDQINQTLPPDYVDDEINLIDLIYPIYKRRKFLIIFCFIVVVLVGLWTIRMPRIYEATAVILPERETEADSGGGQLRAAFMEQFGIAGFGGQSPSSAEIFELQLKSYELNSEILERYNYYYIMGISQGGESLATEGYRSSVRISNGKKDPSVSITVRANDPISATDLANTYIIVLDKFNRTNAVSSAKRLGAYIERRLLSVNKELEKAQAELREFQEKNKAISITKQTEATLEVLSELEAKRVALEVEKAAKQKFYQGRHIEIEQLNAQMDALQKNIERLTYSKEPQVPIDHDKGKVEFYIPLKRIPSLNFQESRLLVNVKAKTSVLTMLITQLEQTKLAAAKDMPIINILDWAKPPEKPIKPNRKMNVLLGAVVSLFIGIFLIFLMEFMQKMEQDPETSPKWLEMKNGLRNTLTLSFLRRKKPKKK